MLEGLVKEMRNDAKGACIFLCKIQRAAIRYGTWELYSVTCGSAGCIRKVQPSTLDSF